MFDFTFFGSASPEDAAGEAMQTLLDEIRRADRSAADELKREGFRTDSEIRQLDRQDLLELFPGVRGLKRRKNIFDIIHKRRPVGALLKDLKEFIPDDALRTALTNNGVLVEYLSMMKDIKTQVDNVQSFLDAHVALLEDIQRSVNQAHPEPHKGPVQGENTINASGPLVSYCGPAGAQSRGAQGPVQGANTINASGPFVPYGGPAGAQSRGAQGPVQGENTINASRPLVPYGGPAGAQSRGAQGPVQGANTINASGPFVPYGGPAGAQSRGAQGPVQGENTINASRPLVPYGGPADAQSRGAQGPVQGANTINASGPFVPYGGPADAQSRGAHGFLAVATVKYQMIVSGKTFGAHEQLMEKVKTHRHAVEFIESNEDFQITVLFCPITSRLGSDVDAALTDMKDNKPVILVLMHHTYMVKHTTSMRTWDCKAVDVLLYVNVFYHETKQGLLTCDENSRAASQIQEEMLKHRVPKIRAGPTHSSNESFFSRAWSPFTKS